MDNTIKVAGLLAAGYVLGRTKRLKTALKLFAAGSQVVQNREQIQDALGVFSDSAEFQELQDKISGLLNDSGKNAAQSAVDKVMRTLQEQIETLNASLDSDDEASQEAETQEPAELEEDAEPEGAEPEDSAEEAEEAPAEEAPAEEAEEAPAEEEPAEEAEAEEASAEEEEPEAEEEAAEEPEAEEQEEEPASSQKSSATPPTPNSTEERREIRRWAQDNGYKVSARGRLSRAVLEAYYEANPPKS